MLFADESNHPPRGFEGVPRPQGEISDVFPRTCFLKSGTRFSAQENRRAKASGVILGKYQQVVQCLDQASFVRIFIQLRSARIPQCA